VIYGGIFLLVITAFGLVHSFWALLVFPVLALSGIMFAAPALCVAAVAKAFEQMFYYITLVITPMYMFSGIFFPPDKLPEPVRKAIWFTPLYHVAHLVRSLVLGTVHPDLLIDVAWMIGFAFIALLFPAALIRRRLLV
jgi:lipooligosaccharide transport system permease protein